MNVEAGCCGGAPTLIAKERARSCGFSVEKYGPQESTDVWAPDCGNGKKPDGTPITGNDPEDTSIAVGPEYVTDWIDHLKGRFGSAADGGVQFYDLDNEPDLWHSTHRDVRPTGLGYDELRDRTYEYAAAIKVADPDAKTLGPVGWGLNSTIFSGLDQDVCSRTGCWGNPPDKAAHGGQDLGPWYLDRMREYEEQHGTRILDYFDIHIYPQQSGVFSDASGDAATQALRLRSTRQLWDPTYVDESWINQPVRFIPRLRDMVDQHYPGTKLAITEYNWGAYGSMNGALAEADVLGIFGREGLDLANLWTAPGADQPVANAFRIYRNYDGKGGAFGETSVRAASADQDKLAVYAAERAGDKALTLVVVNKSGDDLTSAVSLAGGFATTAEVYRYGGANPAGIVREADQAVTSGGFTATFPANSITHLVLPPGPAMGDCQVSYTVHGSWPGGFTTQVTIANTGTKAIDGWKLGFDFPAAGQQVTQGWSAQWRQAGASVTAESLSWNAKLEPDASTVIGFNGAWSGSNPTPPSFTLNGHRCH
ncbi:glycoside hydrolase family 44 protein [Micromonospora sp. NPDC093277]|uniref:glycoside hydrolase family 44 protein n=1 Tax=Micromonospora sp. NPDC093277 TaxID=3364291 RepID=UPI0038152D70